MENIMEQATSSKVIIRQLTPREIVKELDKYIVGQAKAKKSVAIALRNRWRRQQVQGDIRDEISPKNILMIGPTGVGKTEIARRLARLAGSPFIKVEATKFTEVGYVGRDVESMVRDLVHLAVNMVKEEEHKNVEEKAREMAEEQLLDILIPPRVEPKYEPRSDLASIMPESAQTSFASSSSSSSTYSSTREKFREMLKQGKLNERLVELEINPKANMPSSPMVEVFAATGLEDMQQNIQEMLSSLSMGTKRKKRQVKVSEATTLLVQENMAKLIDMDKVVERAVSLVEQSGIVFLDEIDKVAGRGGGGHGPDVSREGVQRDLLPIVEGTTVSTKYGMIKTDHILFIASGAFHIAKPSDLLPELQGRFPIRVELDGLTQEDFKRILIEPENALTKQYQALMQTEGITITFDEGAIAEMAKIAFDVNEQTENIGARRLQTVMERLLEEVSFEAPDIGPQEIKITAEYVRQRLQDVVKDQDLSRFIL